jgi:4-aminobutyrate aminotransferase-like enzyme
VTSAVAEISPSLGEGNPLGAHVRTVSPPNTYRDGPDAGSHFAHAVERAFADLRRSGFAPCALIVDTIFASDGIFAEPPGALREAAAVARAVGAVFIADEVQPGFGRIGQPFWGFARHGVLPDIVTMGKPMGNGHPVAAAVFQPRLLAEFGSRVRYFNTFGGNPVSIAAASAVLDVLEREQLPAHADATGTELRHALAGLGSRHDCIGDVRGAGLFVGVELVQRKENAPDGALCASAVNGLRERGVLVSACGPGANVLKIRPPLPFATEHVAELVSALDDTLTAIG